MMFWTRRNWGTRVRGEWKNKSGEKGLSTGAATTTTTCSLSSSKSQQDLLQADSSLRFKSLLLILQNKA